MNRRGFLKLLGVTAAAPLAAKLPIPVKAAEAEWIKPEAIGISSTLFDGDIIAYKNGGVVTDSKFAEALWPGLNKWYGKQYGRLKP